MTAFRVPDGLKESQIRNKLTERFGITTVGGQEKLKGTIIRIGHMGYTDELDVISTLAALEMTLAELGYDVEPGRAITAAQQVLIGQKARSRSAEDRMSARERNIVVRFLPDFGGSDGSLGWQRIVYW